MENQENKNMYEIEIGKDVPQLNEGKYPVFEYDIVDVQKDGKDIGKKLVLKIKHPINNNVVDISGVKYVIGDKIKETGLWINIDKEGKISYRSALANMMRHYKVNAICNMLNVVIETVVGENGYLIVKAY